MVYYVDCWIFLHCHKLRNLERPQLVQSCQEKGGSRTAKTALVEELSDGDGAGDGSGGGCPWGIVVLCGAYGREISP